MNHQKYEIGAYYFPNYHIDARNEEVHGANGTEWELVRRATPRFENHQQPKVPLWGHEDEADPQVDEENRCGCESRFESLDFRLVLV